MKKSLDLWLFNQEEFFLCKLPDNWKFSNFVFQIYNFTQMFILDKLTFFKLLHQNLSIFYTNFFTPKCLLSFTPKILLFLHQFFYTNFFYNNFFFSPIFLHQILKVRKKDFWKKIGVKKWCKKGRPKILDNS